MTAPATNAQVQLDSDQIERPLCLQITKLYLQCKYANSQFDSVYVNLTNNPTWVDSRTDVVNPAVPTDLLAVNAQLVQNIIHLVEGTFPDLTTANSLAGQWPVIQKLLTVSPLA